MLTPDLLAFVRSSLPAPPARLLEIGAGRGELAEALGSIGYAVTAIDPGAEPGGTVEPVALIDARGAFDAAVAVVSLHHVEPLEESCAHLAALIAPGGRLVVDELDVEGWDERAVGWWLAQRRAQDGAHRGGHRSHGGGHGPHGGGHGPLGGGHGPHGGGHGPHGGGHGSHGDDDLLEREPAEILREMREHIHPLSRVCAALRPHFELGEPVRGPYLHRWELRPSLHTVELELIAEGRLPATGARLVGIRRAG